MDVYKPICMDATLLKWQQFLPSPRTILVLLRTLIANDCVVLVFDKPLGFQRRYDHVRSRILRETWIERVPQPQVKAQERTRNHTHRVSKTQSHGQRRERRLSPTEPFPNPSSRQMLRQCTLVLRLCRKNVVSSNGTLPEKLGVSNLDKNNILSRNNL